MNEKPFFFADYIRDKSIDDDIEESFVIDRVDAVHSVPKEHIEVIDFGYSEAKPKGILLVAHWRQKADVI